MVTDKETCRHDAADIVAPGWTWKRGRGSRAKYSCPECGTWWVAEKPDPSAGYKESLRQESLHYEHGRDS